MFAARLGFMKQATISNEYWIALLSNADMCNFTVDSSNNLYLFGVDNEASYDRSVLVKYDSTGNTVWQSAQNFTPASSGPFSGVGICLDSSGNIYVSCGYNESTTYKVWVAKYDSTGVIQWQQSMNFSTGIVYPYSMVADSSGNLYIVCQNNAGGGTGVILRYNTTAGSLQWQRSYGATASGPLQGAYDVVLDSSNNPIVFGTIFSSTTSRYNMHLARIANAGTTSPSIDIQRLLATNSDDFGYGVDVDSSNYMYICGGGGAATAYPVLAKYSNANPPSLQWQRRLNNFYSTAASYYSTVVDGSYVYAVGLDNTYKTMMIVKYDLSGVIQWQRIITRSDAGTFNIPKIKVQGTKMYIQASLFISPDNSSVLFSLPTDGTKTGTYTLGTIDYTYATGPYTPSTSTLTSAAAGAPLNTITNTTATPTFSDVSVSYTNTTTII